MNKYFCYLKDKENTNAKPIKVEIESLTVAYARKIAEINYPDYKVLKVANA